MLAMLNNLLQLRRAQAGEALALSPTYKQVRIGTNIIFAQSYSVHFHNTHCTYWQESLQFKFYDV